MAISSYTLKTSSYTQNFYENCCFDINNFLKIQINDQFTPTAGISSNNQLPLTLQTLYFLLLILIFTSLTNLLCAFSFHSTNIDHHIHAHENIDFDLYCFLPLLSYLQIFSLLLFSLMFFFPLYLFSTITSTSLIHSNLSLGSQLYFLLIHIRGGGKVPTPVTTISLSN